MATLALEVTDWNESRRAELPDVPDELTVGDLIEELRDPLSLAQDTSYELIWNGEKLNRSATLEESGIETGDELTIAPEVSAGN